MNIGHNYVTALFACMDEPAQGVHINTVFLPALIIMVLHDYYCTHCSKPDIRNINIMCSWVHTTNTKYTHYQV